MWRSLQQRRSSWCWSNFFFLNEKCRRVAFWPTFFCHYTRARVSWLLARLIIPSPIGLEQRARKSCILDLRPTWYGNHGSGFRVHAELYHLHVEWTKRKPQLTLYAVNQNELQWFITLVMMALYKENGVLTNSTVRKSYCELCKAYLGILYTIDRTVGNFSTWGRLACQLIVLNSLPEDAGVYLFEVNIWSRRSLWRYNVIAWGQFQMPTVTSHLASCCNDFNVKNLSQYKTSENL